MASKSNDTKNEESLNSSDCADDLKNAPDTPISSTDNYYIDNREATVSDVRKAIGSSNEEKDSSSSPVNSPATEEQRQSTSIKEQNPRLTSEEFQNPLLSIPGQTGCLVLIVFIVCALLALRYYNILPFSEGNQSESSDIRPACQGSCSPNFIFIATYSFSSTANNNSPIDSASLFYYDQANESIYEVSIDPETTQAKALARGDMGFIASIDKIVLSPDGQKAAIIAAKEKDRTGVYVLNFSRAASDDFIEQWSLGLPQSYLIDGTSNASWSPDGTALVFSAKRESQSDLFLAKSEKEIQRITYLGTNTGTIIWLNDQRLAFVSDWEGKDQLYTIKRDGGDLKKLPR